MAVSAQETLMQEKISFKKKLKDYLDFVRRQPQGFVYLGEKNVAQPPSFKQYQLQQLYQQYVGCQKCPLAKLGRSQVVFGVGSPHASLMFIGEGPGRDEDLKGEPFVGRAGQLLNKIIQAMHLERKDVYISNVVKCRPPQNRTPLPDEAATCSNLLLVKEIAIIQPKIICTLGSPATKSLLGEDVQISKARGQLSSYQSIPVMPTYHPAYLLRNPSAKQAVWEDMKKIMQFLGNNKS